MKKKECLMKLNADILYLELSSQYRITMNGPHEKRLTLSRPEFYMDGEDSFLTDHLYLATAEHLPRRPKIQRGAVLVCIGESNALRYFEERLCLITIHNRTDFFKAYHFLQNIFNRYDEWERNLYRDLLKDGSIQLMIRDSFAVFSKSLVLLDSSFHIMASAGNEAKKKEWGSQSSGALNAESLSTFLNASDLQTERHGALRIEIKGNRTLCVNLFDRFSQYEGCLCIAYGEEEFNEGEDRLAEFLAGMIETAIEKNPLLVNEEQPSVKSLLRTLVDEQPISQSQRLILNGANLKTDYVCAILRYANKKNRIPYGYICDSFEEQFRDSWAFQSDEGVVCFLKTDHEVSGSPSGLMKHEGMRLKEFCESMKLKAGISSVFNDLFDIRIHHTQAICAIENGILFNPAGILYFFEEYALNELVLNALGDLPSNAYFPSGLSEIIRHDDASGVSYLETLRVFLEENLSYTSAARRLYIHRSTLIDRIARIERELDISLKNPDQRLRMEIILKAIEIEKRIHT